MIKNYNAAGEEIDLTGYLIKEQENPEVYRIIDRINEEGKHEGEHQSNC